MRSLRGNDLLIAIERPPPAKNGALAIGIAGRGFDGDLTSDSTRLDGYVLSTDVAPTILLRLGVGVPSQMSGQPIRAEGSVDPAAVTEFGDRMAVISERRGPVIGLSLLAWIVVLGLAIAVTRGAAARTGVRLAGLAVGVCAAFVFAAGRFGADVGAAIVFPVGAAVAAAAVAARRRRSALLAIALPFAVLALLALVDLLSGANAHLTRSVLDAGGLGDLGNVAQRRLQLSANSFSRPIVFVFLPLIVALAALAVARRDRLRSWLGGQPAMRAGLLGAVAATAVGTLANDSGALLLEIGAAYLLVFTGFAWAERAPVARRP